MQKETNVIEDKGLLVLHSSPGLGRRRHGHRLSRVSEATPRLLLEYLRSTYPPYRKHPDHAEYPTSQFSSDPRFEMHIVSCAGACTSHRVGCEIHKTL